MTGQASSDHDDSITVIHAQPQPAAVVRGTATTLQISAFLGGAFTEVLDALEQQHRPPAGPPFACFLPNSQGGFDIVAGFPCGGVVQPAGRVEPHELPGGSIAQIMYRGDYSGVAEAYESLRAWADDHGYVQLGGPWESYLDEPDVLEPRTLVQMPCRAATTSG